VIKLAKDQLRLTGCRARAERAQLHHTTCRLIAFGVLARARHARQLSLDKLKRQLSFKGHAYALPALKRLQSAA
jgi:hypothetical protein